MSDSQPTPSGPAEPNHIVPAHNDQAHSDPGHTDPGHTDDPEILELLSFEPVPRMFKRKDGWTPALQRKFIVLLARTGSPTAATEALGKNRFGVEKLYKAAGAAGFRAAWDAAIELFEERAAERLHAEHMQGAGARPPFVDRRRKAGAWAAAPGQMLNEHGEYEDEESIRQRALEAKDNISRKLLNCRRLYLREISSSPGKRAAFEILTEYAIDWDKAERLEPQADEPFRKPNMRQPDMLLTAENGWMGDMAHGPNKMAVAREALNEELVQRGKPPIDWSQDEDASQTHPSRDSSGRGTSEAGGGAGFTPAEQPSSSQDKAGPRIRGL